MKYTIEPSVLHPFHAVVRFIAEDNSDRAYTFSTMELAQIWVEGRIKDEAARAQELQKERAQ